MMLASRARIRPPAVAGRFYPAGPARLRADVMKMLAASGVSEAPAPKAVIAPHAGYVYSGQVAAAAFAAIGPAASAVSRVVVIGPTHYVAICGIAVPTVGAFATPLGEIACDRNALQDISRLAAVTANDAAHAPDHALEVELPFLQVVLGRFTLVPLLVGDARPADVAEVLRELWGGPETLIVVSSDLSHFHRYETARRLDAETGALIEAGNWAALGPDRACGAAAIAGLLVETGRRGIEARRLGLCNSGDTAGNRQRVVGYGAWAFAEASPALQ